MKNNSIGCIVICSNTSKIEEIEQIKKFQSFCSNVPILIYGNMKNIPLIFELGKTGADSLISKSDINFLFEQITAILEETNFHIDFSKYGIKKNKCTLEGVTIGK